MVVDRGLGGKDPLPLKTSNFLQCLARIVTNGIYLILCGFNECCKTIRFFKMPHVSYLDKNRRILEDSMGGDPLPLIGCFWGVPLEFCLKGDDIRLLD